MTNRLPQEHVSQDAPFGNSEVGGGCENGNCSKSGRFNSPVLEETDGPVSQPTCGPLEESDGPVSQPTCRSAEFNFL